MEEVNKEVNKDLNKDLNRLIFFDCVKRFRSVARAIKRGNVTEYGTILPKRPFNNRKNKPLEYEKRKIYADIKKLRDNYYGSTSN